MPFPMKIQPIDSNMVKGSIRNDLVPPVKPVVKSRFKRLFEKQFPSIMRTSSVEKPDTVGGGGGGGDLEPNSVCLAKMVQNFMEEINEKPSATVAAAKCVRHHRCNCFNGSCSDSSDDESDFYGGDSVHATLDATEILKSLVPCATVAERNLLADTAKIVDKNKICKRKEDFRKIVTEGLSFLGYEASICKSRWEKSKSPSYPSGKYEYIDVMIEGERLIVDIDFKSEFEIARSTKNYRSVLHLLPSIFIGKADRLQQIVTIVSEAAKQSLKKKGMHLPPWRKADYMRAKWLSPYTKTSSSSSIKPIENTKTETGIIKSKSCLITTKNFSGEFELIFGEKLSKSLKDSAGESASIPAGNHHPNKEEEEEEEEKIKVVVSPWKPPAIKPKNDSQRGGGKIVTGLASVLKEKP